MSNQGVYTEAEVEALLTAERIKASKGGTTKTTKGNNKPVKEYPDVVQELLDSKSVAEFICHLIHMWMAYKKRDLPRHNRQAVWFNLVKAWNRVGNTEKCNLLTFENFKEEVFPYLVSVELSNPTSVLSIAMNIHNQLSNGNLGKDETSDMRYKAVMFDLNTALIEQLKNEDDDVKSNFSAWIEEVRKSFPYGTAEWNALLNEDVSGNFRLTNHKRGNTEVITS